MYSIGEKVAFFQNRAVLPYYLVEILDPQGDIVCYVHAAEAAALLSHLNRK